MKKLFFSLVTLLLLLGVAHNVSEAQSYPSVAEIASNEGLSYASKTETRLITVNRELSVCDLTTCLGSKGQSCNAPGSSLLDCIGAL